MTVAGSSPPAEAAAGGWLPTDLLPRPPQATQHVRKGSTATHSPHVAQRPVTPPQTRAHRPVGTQSWARRPHPGQDTPSTGVRLPGVGRARKVLGWQVEPWGSCLLRGALWGLSGRAKRGGEGGGPGPSRGGVSPENQRIGTDRRPSPRPTLSASPQARGNCIRSASPDRGASMHSKPPPQESGT